MTAGRPRVHGFAIELTAVCQQRCPYCYDAAPEPVKPPAGGAERLRAAHPDARTLRARIERLLTAFEIGHVTLTGGEPLAQPALWDVLELCAARHAPVRLISNGGWITDTVAHRLARYGVRSVQVTLNGPDAALHGEHTGAPAHFDRARRGVRALRAAGVTVIGCMVVTRLNAHYVGATLELWRSQGVADVALSRFSPAGRAVEHAGRLLPTQPDLAIAFRQALVWARTAELRITSTMPIPPCLLDHGELAPIRFGSCAIGTDRHEPALGADGRLRLCTLHPDPIGRSGDVLDPALDLPGLLRSAEVTRYRSRHPAFCDGCIHARSCGGGCGAAAYGMLGPGPDGRRHADPLLWQHLDERLAARLGRGATTADPRR